MHSCQNPRLNPLTLCLLLLQKYVLHKYSEEYEWLLCHHFYPYDHFDCCIFINWHCRVLTNLYIPGCMALHFLNHFFKLMTDRGPYFTSGTQLLSLRDHIGGWYLQKLENKVGTLVDFSKRYFSSMDLHLLLRLETVFFLNFDYI